MGNDKIKNIINVASVKIKKIASKALKAFLDIEMFLLGMFDKDGNLLLPMLCSLMEKRSSNYISYRLRPKNAESFIDSSIKTASQPGELAVVLQGLIEMRDNFTLETVKFYKHIFPGATIIVSTWDYTPSPILDLLRIEGCDIVLNKDFSPCGFGNINYQLCTSLAGCKRAKELGAKYVLKNRSDLRIYREFSFEYLKSLLDIFPIKGDNPCGMKGRIVTQAGNPAQMFIPLWLQDFIYFGYADDLIKLFDTSYDDRDVHSGQKYMIKTYGKITGAIMIKEQVPEISITTRFLFKYMHTNCTVEIFWQLVKELFIIVDAEDLGTLWSKYGLQNLSNYYCEYDGRHNFTDEKRHISFLDFVNIYNNQYTYEEWMELIHEKYEV